MSNDPEYSVVIPVYNGQNSIEELCERIRKVFETITSNYEIIFIDDNSKDGSWEVLKKIHRNNENIKIIHLMKNYGQHSATLCGFKQSKGKYVITLDDDLQNPPEEIPKILEASRKGYWVVFGRYPTKKSDFITKILSNYLQMLIQKICGLPKTITTSSFSVYHREVINNIIEIKSAFPFLPALIASSVSPDKIINIDVLHNERKTGKSNYNFFSHFKFSLNLIINYSSLPLIALSVIGFILSFGSFLVSLSIIINRIIDPSYGLVGWNSMMVAICFIGGAILMGMGIIGEYLRRILTEVSHGQQYVIDEMDL
jgi:glycosyltransferase involved in cell wall biosynthesis